MLTVRFVHRIGQPRRSMLKPCFSSSTLNLNLQKLWLSSHEEIPLFRRKNIRSAFASCLMRRTLSTMSEKKTTPFKILDGTIDSTTKSFQQNLKFYQKIEEIYFKNLSVAMAGGSEKAKQRHTVRNKKMLVTDRIKLLFDDASDMLEIAPFAGLGMDYGDIPRASGISAIGKIHGVQCMVVASDATVKAATIFPISLKKQLRAQEIAQQNCIPCVYLIDSGGAFLPMQAEIFTYGGRLFYNEAIMNSMNIPQVTVVCGSCTAGAAYIPTMGQEAVIVHRLGTIFLGGPPLVKAALGEEVSPEDLGGGLMHSTVSGCTDYFVQTEPEAYETTRDIVAAFNMQPPEVPSGYDEPLFDPAELHGLVPEKDQHTMDIHKIIARITDGSRFQEFKAVYDTGLVTGFAYIQGYMAGIIANNGSMTAKAAIKGAHFVQLCDQRNIPLVFLQNTEPEFASNSTQTGADLGILVKSQASLMTAVACAEVPKITIIVGNSFGIGNHVMCGRSFDPNFVFCWPNAKIGVTDPDTLEQTIFQEKVPNRSKVSEADFIEHLSKIRSKVSHETTGLYSSAHLWDDGLILPKDTRRVLGKCLEIVQCSPIRSSPDKRQCVMRM